MLLNGKQNLTVDIGMSVYNIGTIDLYYATDYHGNFYGETEKVLVDVGGKVTARVGYAFPITRYFSLIPQIGLNVKIEGVAASFEELLAETEEGTSYHLNTNLDYSELEKNYTRYVQSPKCLPTLGVRMELKIQPYEYDGSIVGLYVTPEYSIHEGFAISVGIVGGFGGMWK